MCIQISNQLAAFLAFLLAVYPFVYIYYGFYQMAYVTLIGSLLNASVLVANRSRSFPKWGRIQLVVINNILIFAYSLLLGRDVWAHLFFINLCCVPYLIFEKSDKWHLIIWSLVPGALFFVLEIWGYSYSQLSLDLSEEEKKRLFLVISPSIFIILLVYINYFFLTINRNEERLWQKIQDLRLSKNLIEEQQVKLASASHFSALGELSGNIAHEINNPLAIIQGYAEQMERMLQSRRISVERMDKMCSRILLTVQRISKIISGLQQLSRDASDDPWDHVDLRQVITDSVEFCNESLTRQGIEIIVDFRVDAAGCHCRPVQMTQVLLNLIHNSKDAVQDLADKWIRIILTDAIDSWEISVVDSGFGLSADVLAKIDRPFFTTKPPGKGTGLGLSISRKIVSAHGGYLKVANRMPHTTFIIGIPKIAPEFENIG